MDSLSQPLTPTVFDLNTSTPTAVQVIGNIYSTGSIVFVAAASSEVPELGVIDAAGTRLISAPLRGATAAFFQRGPEGAAYFLADDHDWGFELWRSDGTQQGTERITDCAEGGESTFSREGPHPAFAVIEAGAVFACEGSDGREPHIVDLRTGEVRPLGDLAPGNSDPRWFTAIGNRIFFAATVLDDAGTPRRAPFVTDGTTAGTRVIGDSTVAVGKYGADTAPAFVGVKDQVFFANASVGSGSRLFVTDGTTAGTRIAASGLALYPAFTALGDQLLFFGDQRLKAIAPDGGISDLGSAPSLGAPAAPNRVDAPEWVSAAGRKWIAPYYSQVLGTTGRPAETVTLTAFTFAVGTAADKVLFSVFDGGGGSTLCASDGTVECEPLAAFEHPFAWNFASLGAGAVVQSSQLELWQTDGTAAGTRRLPPIVGPLTSSRVAAMTVTDGGILFGAFDGEAFGLYLATGRNLSQLARGSQDGGPAVTAIAVLNDAIVVLMDNTLWRFRSGQFEPLAPITQSNAAVVNQRWFGVSCGQGTPSVWVTDGTDGGTSILYQASPSSGCRFGNLASVGNGAYFNLTGTSTLAWSDGVSLEPAVDDGPWYPLVGGVGRVWTSDGSNMRRITRLDAGSFEVATIGGARLVEGRGLEWRGELYFAGQADSGQELFRTNGNSDSVLVADLFTGRGGSKPGDFVVAGDRLFFSALTRDAGRELWVLDHRDGGPRLVADVSPGVASGFVGPALGLDPEGVVVFAGRTVDSGVELWVTDGSASGTRRLTEVGPGEVSSWPQDFVRSGPWLYFTATGDGAGRELRSVKVAVLTDTTAPVISGCVDQQFDQEQTGAIPRHAAPTVTDDVSSLADVAITMTPTSVSTVGDTVISFHATDEAGNSAMCRFTVTVRAAPPPQVTCPPDVATETDGASAAATWPAATSMDGVVVSDEPASGSTFPVGRTTVTRTAVNALGTSNRCSFAVAVRQTEPLQRCGCSITPSMVVLAAIALRRRRISRSAS